LQQLNRVLNDVIKRNLQSGLEPGIFNDGLPRFMIYVSSEDPAEPGTYATWRGVLIEDDVGDGAPVLARLCCFGCSLSDGERERERFLFESDSGIAGCFFFSARFDQDSDVVWGAKASGERKSIRGGGVWERIGK